LIIETIPLGPPLQPDNLHLALKIGWSGLPARSRFGEGRGIKGGEENPKRQMQTEPSLIKGELF
jgi:hypothetical protein